MKKLSLLLLLCVLAMAVPAAQAEQTILTATVPGRHTLALSLGEGGSIIVNGTTLTEGASITLDRHERVVIELKPDPGCGLDTVTVSSDYGVTLESGCVVIERMVQDMTAGFAFRRYAQFDTEAVLPGMLAVIGEEAFAGSGVQAFVVGEGCTAIESRAFADCANLVMITLPRSVTSIAPDAFDGSGDLVIAAPAGSYAQQYAAEHEMTFMETW